MNLDLVSSALAVWLFLGSRVLGSNGALGYNLEPKLGLALVVTSERCALLAFLDWL